MSRPAPTTPRTPPVPLTQGYGDLVRYRRVKKPLTALGMLPKSNLDHSTRDLETVVDLTFYQMTGKPLILDRLQRAAN